MTQTPEELIPTARALRAKLLADPHRPRYHLVAPEGVCAPFDPNGALFWKGRYHLFYILQNEKGHCWGHWSSLDLVHWRHHSVALAPESGDVDEGIFSGGAFVDSDGVPSLVYWGLGEQAGICLATSTDDDLEHWTKHPANPVIAHTKPGDPGHGVYNVADPSAVWMEDGRYYILLGNYQVLNNPEFAEFRADWGPEEKGDTLYLFVSDDLVQWEYLHEFYRGNRVWTRDFEDNMCPDFFPLGNRHMLLFISHPLGCQYYLGRYEDDRFRPEVHERMTWVDNAFFAPESLLDDGGRRIMWAWIFDGREEATRRSSGWSGTMCLPRVLWLGEDGALRLAPPEELQVLRYNERQLGPIEVPAEGEVAVEGVSGDSLELAIELEVGESSECGVTVCASPEGQERTDVFYDAQAKMLKIDTARASLGEGPKSVEGGPLELAPGEPLRLRVFVDRSVVEVFANERQAVMRRIYPTRRDRREVTLFARGAGVRARAVTAWDMAPSNAW